MNRSMKLEWAGPALLIGCTPLCVSACGTSDGAQVDLHAPGPETATPDSGIARLRDFGASIPAKGTPVRAMDAAVGCSSDDRTTIPPSAEADRFIETLRARYMASPTAKPGPHRPSGSPPASMQKHSIFPVSVATSVARGCGRLAAAFPADVADLPGVTTVSFPEHADAPFELEERRTGVRLAGRLVGARSVPLEVSQGYVLYRDALPNGVAVIHVPTPTGTEDLLTLDGPETSSVSYEVELGDKVAGLRLFANTLEFLDVEGMPRLRISPPYVLDANLKRHAATLALSRCTADTSTAPPWDHPVRSPGSKSCTVTVSWNAAELAYPALLDPSWTSTASLAVGRTNHVAGLLNDGTVLIAGGYTGNYVSLYYTDRAERFKLGADGSGAWAAAAPMKAGARADGLGVSRQSRFFMISGDTDGDCIGEPVAEFFSTTTNDWAPTAPPPHGRYADATATLLFDGRIVVIGGSDGDCYSQVAQSWVDIYDPARDQWTHGPDLPVPRAGHQTVRVADGRLLVLGGFSDDGVGARFFDPTQNQWTVGPTLNHGFGYHGAVSLSAVSPDVLVFGGWGGGATERWTGGPSFRTVSSLFAPRSWAYTDIGWTALADGSAIALFGRDWPNFNLMPNAEVFNPVTEQWSVTGLAAQPRDDFTITDLSGTGKALLVGGSNYWGDSSAMREADLYTYAPAGGPPVSQFCGDGVRDPVREECDLGEAVPERDLCSADCRVKDLLGIADGGSATTSTRREIGEGRHPVATSADGGFAFVFVEPDSSPLRLGLSSYDADGIPSDTVIPISAGSTPVLMSNPVVAGVPGNKYAVAYTDFDGDGDKLGVVLRLIDPHSVSPGPPMRVNTITNFSQYDADLIATPSGLLAAWLDDSDVAKGPDIKFRTFDFDLTPTSAEQVLADSAANEGDVALAPFGTTWAAAWRAGQDGAETLYVRTGSTTWTLGPYLAGPVGDRPALAEVDTTHLLVAFAEGTDPGGTGISNGSTIRVALLDIDHPGPAAAVDLPVSVSNPVGTEAWAQSQANAVRVGIHVYLGWRTERASGDPLGEELWIKPIPTALTQGALDLSSLEIPLPRVDADRAGDQRRPGLAAGHATFYGEVVTAYEDWGHNFSPQGHGVIAIEALPNPILRP